MTGTSIKRTRNDLIFDIFNLALLTVFVLVVLYPLYFVVIASISDPDAVYQGRVFLLPADITFVGYENIFKNDEIWSGYANSLLYTASGIIVSVVLTLLTAYPLSRKDFAGRGAIMFFFTFTMIFSGGMIPTYLNIRNLGMINTMWAIVLPGALTVYNLIIARTFYRQTIPEEILDAAMIDGCSNTRFFLRIVLPLSPTLIAIMVLFYGVNYWNEYFSALLYISDKSKYPLQVVLRGILLLNQRLAQMSMEDDPLIFQRIADQVKYGVIIMASLPLMILYPFLQKYFVKGLVIGSVKG